MVELRTITSSDLNILYEWRNNKHIISLSASQNPVTFIEHSEWFNNIISGTTTKIFIILNDRVPIGQIRFDKIEDEDNSCEVSIYLIPGQEKKGIGSKALKQGIKLILQFWNIDRINAWVRQDNEQSQFFFKKNNFVEEGKNEKLILFTYYSYNKIKTLIVENQQYYDQRAKKYGNSYKSLNWGSVKSQHSRFKVLSQIGELHNKSVLDFGCGVGDLYDWLISNEFNVDYTGIDISSKMIEEARKQFPNGRFFQKNIFNSPLEKSFDYILLSGIFTYTNQTFFEECISLLFENCTKGVGFNLLSDWNIAQVDEQEKEFVANPIDILCFCKKLTDKLSFRHDYHPRDFTIFLYK